MLPLSEKLGVAVHLVRLQLRTLYRDLFKRPGVPVKMLGTRHVRCKFEAQILLGQFLWDAQSSE